MGRPSASTKRSVGSRGTTACEAPTRPTGSRDRAVRPIRGHMQLRYAYASDAGGLGLANSRLAIISAILGPVVTIAHRELLIVTGNKRGVEIKLELSVERTSTEDDIRNNVLTGRKLVFGNAVKKQEDAKISGREIKNYSTNSRIPSNLKDSSNSRMPAGPSMKRVKLEGSTSKLALNIPNPQHIRKFPYKHSSRNSDGDSINEDWKQKMLEASDEILKFLNRDYNAHAHKRTPVHN
ncbi:hypothetical protein PR202_ga14886 [Eleusine coracana subsp. coracana]|uniref:Uncharacterized protein n=1 Tax=Eleusine coracana subsp. coracana TaxID=191504 RepID=A0AAV5CHW3_ELECO|nr:hypothetical protein PR202_ga14886 [Eleusine coracana subsp. coracana]